MAGDVGDDRRHIPGKRAIRRAIDHGVHVCGERAVEVLGDAAAGDVRDGVHRALAGAAQHLEHRLHIDARGSKQRVGQALAAQLLERLLELSALGRCLGRARNQPVDPDNLAHKRVPVGMDTCGGQAQDHIARANVGWIEHLWPVDHAHREASEIVIVRAHDTGVLGHLAAHERSARELAAVGHALHDLGHMLGLDVPDGDIVEEEQRLRARREDVVHAHGDEILAHRLVAVEQLREHQLGAHTIRAADEDGVLHILERRSGEQPAESTDTADDLGAVGGGDHLLDRIDGAAALGGIDAGVLVGDVLGLLAHALPFAQGSTCSR